MRIISLCLVFVLSIITVNSGYAQTRMFSTLELVDGVSLTQEREKVIAFMQGQEVQKKMISLGINPLEAVQRVAGLSAKELSLLSQEIDTAPAGADGGVGTIVGAALLVFLVLLITDIMGYTNVFPFTKSAR